MRILGIVTEYNPFHNGHMLHISNSKKVTGCTHTVAVMSGNYVQRGEPAICDKYIRTRAALENGVDIVIELPIFYSTSSAEYFSQCAIGLLDKTGVVDCICFGSEKGELDKLNLAAQLLQNESKSFKQAIKDEVAKGLPYPKARFNALQRTVGENMDFLNYPNNILGVEYLKALKTLNSSIVPFTISRELADYHSKDLQNYIASATAIRSAVESGNFYGTKDVMPAYKGFAEIISEGKQGHIDKFSQIFHYSILNSTPNALVGILDVTEGLENRILKATKETYLISDIIQMVKTKRYALTKIQRALLHIILNITKAEFENYNQLGMAQYIRVLGFRRDSLSLLSEMTKKASVPVFTNLKDARGLPDEARCMLEKEIWASDLYYLAMQWRCGRNIEFKKPVVIV